jgi:hypothetical protein
MKYTSVTNLSWSKDKAGINCSVLFERLGILPFHATQNDEFAHGREIYERCIAGEFGEIADYVFLEDEGPNPKTTASIPSIPTTTTTEIL